MAKKKLEDRLKDWAVEWVKKDRGRRPLATWLGVSTVVIVGAQVVLLFVIKSPTAYLAAVGFLAAGTAGWGAVLRFIAHKKDNADDVDRAGKAFAILAAGLSMTGAALGVALALWTTVPNA